MYSREVQQFTGRCRRKDWPLPEIPGEQVGVDEWVLPQRSLCSLLGLGHFRANRLALMKGESKTSLIPGSTIIVTLTQTNCSSIIYQHYISEKIFSSYALLRAKIHQNPWRASINLEQPHLSIVYSNLRGEEERGWRKVPREKQQV